MVLLHGTLELEVEGGSNLWGKSRTFAERFCQTLVISREPDPYVTAQVGGKKGRRILKSKVEWDTDSPKWDCKVRVEVAEDVEWVVVHVKTKPRFGWERVVKAKSLGYVWIPAGQLVQERCFGKQEVELRGRWRERLEKKVRGSFSGSVDASRSGQVEGVRRKPGKLKVRGNVVLGWKYWPWAETKWEKEGLGPTNIPRARIAWEVPEAYFGVTEGNLVDFYQDADCWQGWRVPVKGWVPRRCWWDMYNDTLEARNFIFVAAWSVHTEIRMIRDNEGGNERGHWMTVGELLKKKADEGVVVKVFIWDEIVSTTLNKAGLMDAHDEETMEYFRGSEVDVLKVSREDDGLGGCCGGLAVGGLWTFHQKIWICDAAVPGELQKRQICAYVGGFDITSGRWDTQEHSLFQTLDTVHKSDFHQKCIFPSPDKGPREPWHDVHSRVYGPAAWQILQNFTERWNRHSSRRLYNPRDGIGSEFLSPEEGARYNVAKEQGMCWNAQIFRSIDARSCAFTYPDSPGLHEKKGRLVEATVQKAYIHIIRKAKRFVYIENQYFMGSSYSWSHKKSLAPNLVPIELSLKIEEKIAAGEDFHAYILIPMFPEGQIGDRATEELLYWQKSTCEMITRRIARALAKHKKITDRHPLDYISFYCLANRERRNPKDGPGVTPPPRSGRRAFRSRRFMIYVHSKLMIVDDEVAILGSANINERSMSGSRDVEICASYWQPHLVDSPEAHKGGVGLFRKSLWYEHLGELPPSAAAPESLACVREVRRAAENNWNIFCGEEHADLPAHLLKYPYNIGKDGTISATVKHFPDAPRSSVLGYDTILPDILTA